MALDRTTTYTSANIGYSTPLTDKLQLNLDATAAHIDGTIASFGVDALPSTGNEFYYLGAADRLQPLPGRRHVHGRRALRRPAGLRTCTSWISAHAFR